MWKECTEERHDEMLCVLPPAYWDHNGFLVGEPSTHRTCKVTGRVAPTFAAFVSHNGKYYESAEPYTLAEFRAFDVKELPTETVVRTSPRGSG